MFDLQHTPVSITIERISELIDSVTTQNTTKATTGQITPFHSRAIPCIPIKDYLERVTKFVYLENDTLIAVLVYLDRISRAQPSLSPSPYNIHRLVITAIVVAHKFNSDIFFNNARYSKVGGIPLTEMNQLELEMLFLIKFDLKIDLSEMQHVGEWLINPDTVFQSSPTSTCSPGGGLLDLYFRQHQCPLTPPTHPIKMEIPSHAFC